MITHELFSMFKEGKDKQAMFAIYPKLTDSLYVCYEKAYQIYSGHYKDTTKERKFNKVFDLIEKGTPYKQASNQMKLSPSTYSRYIKIHSILTEYEEYLKSIEAVQMKLNNDIEDVQVKLNNDSEDVPSQTEIHTITEEESEDTELQSKLEEEFNNEDDASFLEAIINEGNQELQDLLGDFEEILASFKKMVHYVTNVRTFYDDIGNYNINQQKLLHKLENSKDIETFMSTSIELFELRKKRRIGKERYTLSYALLQALKRQKIHTGLFYNVITPVQDRINSVRSPRDYNTELKEISNPSFEEEAHEQETQQTQQVQQVQQVQQDNVEQIEKPKPVYVSNSNGDTKQVDEDMDDWKKKLKMFTSQG